jgi:uncharacterized protein YjbJ (UPF0337 family)
MFSFLRGNYFLHRAARLLQKGICARQTAWQNKTKIKHANHMSTLTAKGNWNIAKGKLKQKFAQLTDDDLQYLEGKEDELIGRIQKRTSQAKEKIEQTVDECRGRKH